MLEKLEKIVARYNFLTEEISKPEVIADNNSWKKLVKEHSNLTPIVECYNQYCKAKSELDANMELLEIETDKEMLALLHEDVNLQKKALEDLLAELKVLLLPKDPNDDKTLSLKYVRAQAVKRRLCSPTKFAVCTTCLRKRTVGRLKKLISTKTNLGA